MRDFSEAELNVLKNAKRILKKHAQTRRRAFTEPAHIKSYLQCDNAVREAQTLREEFRVMYLDTQHRLIKDEILFSGTIDASPVYPRVVVQRALENNAGAVIFAHNHPSGVPEPSTADRNITKRLQDALMLIDVRVLDHFIIGDENIVSFAERGLL